MGSPKKEVSPSETSKESILSRRGFIIGGAGAVGAAAIGATLQSQRVTSGPNTGPAELGTRGHATMMPGMIGEVDHVKNRFNPTALLTDFDAGRISTLPSGQILHEYSFVVQNQTVEVMPGLEFAAWTYNGRIPGPTIRVTEGDRVRVELLNASDHAHSIHFHGIHPGVMDGVFDAQSGVVAPSGKYIYEFDAEPFGTHLYHCHTAPLAKHIAKGLYGAFIIDPKVARPKADREFVMVMSGYDVDFDGANDLYVVNGIPFHYDHDRNPIKLKVGEMVRIHLINALEYDPVNSFHLHANFFHYYPTGTSLTPSEFTDTIALMQGQRGILEFSYRYPGKYMFHAHKTEFAELGWTGVFDVEA